MFVNRHALRVKNLDHPMDVLANFNVVLWQMQ